MRRLGIEMILLLCSVLICSCAHTRLPAREIVPEARRLAQINARPIRYQVDCPVDEIIGHQYLFIALPFGRISLENPAHHLSNALYRELSLAGYSPREATDGTSDFIVHCNDLSLSAYDYLLFRHLVAIVNISIEHPKIPSSPPISTHTRIGAFKAFGFYQQLEHLWQEALQQAAHSIVSANHE